MIPLPFVLPLAAALALGASADTSSVPITGEMAAHAVLAAHPEFAGDRIRMLAPLRAHSADPLLVAGPVEHGAGESRVRLHCAEPGACMPFYVAIDGTSGAPVPATPKGPAAIRAAHEATPILRSGARALLLIDSGALHLRLTVTTLGSGNVGDRVRVSSRGQVFEASVLDATTLRGTL